MSSKTAQSSSRSPETFKVLLKKLAQSPDDFSPDDVAECFRHLCQVDGKGASEAQIGAFMTALTLSGLDSSPQVVAACAAVLREHSISVSDIVHNPSSSDSESRADDNSASEENAYKHEKRPGVNDAGDEDEGDGYDGLVDIVGTGGDGYDTYNVSTTAAVVVAGAGIKVAKHGSKAATSTSGSADLLISLGASLTFPPSSLPTILSSSTFLFLFAPHYHPSLAHLAPIRRQLNFRTVFNVLGPLINPAKPGRMVLGVAKKELGDTFAEVLKLLRVERALVVCGKEGLDEISCAGETWTWELNNGEITTGSIHPTEDFGLPLHSITSVRGSTPDLNALTFRHLIDPTSTPVPPHLSAPADADSPSIDAIRDYVLLQAAALIKISGRASTYKKGVELARKSMEEGGAARAWEGFRKASVEAMKKAEGSTEPEDDGGVAAKGGMVPPWRHAEEKKEKEEKEEEKKA